MDTNFKAGYELGQLLLRQSKIDIDGVECRQRDDLLTRVNHLAYVYLANTELSIERRVHFFFSDHRAHVINRALLLPEGRFSGVEFGLRNNLARSQIARSLQIRAG